MPTRSTILILHPDPDTDAALVRVEQEQEPGYHPQIQCNFCAEFLLGETREKESVALDRDGSGGDPGSQGLKQLQEEVTNLSSLTLAGSNLTDVADVADVAWFHTISRPVQAQFGLDLFIFVSEGGFIAEAR